MDATPTVKSPFPETLVALLPRCCHFVVGKNKRGVALFCGNAVESGSWCEGHRQIVFSKDSGRSSGMEP